VEVIVRSVHVLVGLLLIGGPVVAAEELPREETAGTIETIATFDGPMPTEVTVSHSGRIFVNFPRWGTRSTSPSPRSRTAAPCPTPTRTSTGSTRRSRPST
jgi:hypothetical protein